MTGIKVGVLLSLMLFGFVSCGNDPFDEYESLEKDMKTLEKTVKDLSGRNLTSEEILEGLGEGDRLVKNLQGGRDEMAREREKLISESYELNGKRIEALEKGRFSLYEGMDDFLVCSYRIYDEIKKNMYYHERELLSGTLENVQRNIISLIQRDPPHSAKSSFSYYKNIPSITSQTADDEGNWYYTIKVNIGYNFNEKDTQTILNASKAALGGLIRSYFSSMTKEESLTRDEAHIKAGLVMVLNEYLIQFSRFKDKKMEGVKLVTFDMIQYYEFQ